MCTGQRSKWFAMCTQYTVDTAFEVSAYPRMSSHSFNLTVGQVLTSLEAQPEPTPEKDTLSGVVGVKKTHYNLFFHWS